MSIKRRIFQTNALWFIQQNTTQQLKTNQITEQIIDTHSNVNGSKNFKQDKKDPVLKSSCNIQVHAIQEKTKWIFSDKNNNSGFQGREGRVRAIDRKGAQKNYENK